MKYLVLIAAWLSLSACATVIRGAKDTAKFESSPTGATVTTNSLSEDQLGPYTCLTPCELELKRKRTWRVDFSLEGYKPVSALLEPVVTGGGVAAGAGNLIAGGIIGLGIDAGTGANLDLKPNPMIAELVPLGSAVNSQVLNAEGIIDQVIEEEITIPTTDPVATQENESPSLENSTPTDSVNPVDTYNNISDIIEEDVVLNPAMTDALTGEAENLATKTSIEQTPHLYKPGERAPNDEVSDDLNRQSLKLLNPTAIRKQN